MHLFAMFPHTCSLAADRKFGPLIQCKEFDFTLVFEQSILVIAVSTLFLISIPLRLKKVLSQDEKTFATKGYYAKLVSFRSMRRTTLKTSTYAVQALAAID